ncbi:hypothetical protein Hoch_0464 [Haliangium ochraceum DSM 14365]|uniref:Uncharacterized protein n=2 Tax=Haliangium ochraceum TaxID=80816 RepID=D0LK71_HALO1|nr:hypothetical protein Hoch_0464 [Haliangium ochraceum DSM 14365]
MAQACGGGLEIVAVAVRLGVVVLVVMCTLAEPAQAQSAIRAGDVSQPALVHQDEVTGLVYPDTIARVQPMPEDVLLFETFENRLYVLPKKGTEPGTEVMLEVETRAQRLILWVLVVKQVQDADKRLIVLAPGSPYGDEPDMRRELASSMYEGAEEWETSVATEAGEAEATEGAGVEAAAEDAAMVVVDASENAPEPAPTEGQPFELSVHALGGLGVTALAARRGVGNTRVAHATTGIRLGWAPSASFWEVEADARAAWPTGALTVESDEGDETTTTSGTWLRGTVGVKVGAGEVWRSSLRASVGGLAHVRSTVWESVGEQDRSESMPLGAVFSVGAGLERRLRGDLVVGIDWELSRSGLDDYLAVGMQVSVGRILEKRSSR